MANWQKPKLIVLGRGTPEEHVLTGCKHPGHEGPTGGTKCGNMGADGCKSNAAS